jgi:hypothetical protein
MEVGALFRLAARKRPTILCGFDGKALLAVGSTASSLKKSTSGFK